MPRCILLASSLFFRRHPARPSLYVCGRRPPFPLLLPSVAILKDLLKPRSFSLVKRSRVKLCRCVDSLEQSHRLKSSQVLSSKIQGFKISSRPSGCSTSSKTFKFETSSYKLPQHNSLRRRWLGLGIGSKIPSCNPRVDWPLLACCYNRDHSNGADQS
ncbi:hypothetical protein C8F04DRAFT_1229980 [Mycena alexandri]|uniref:Uncharacterized protein n=1 Tax=Mycena alexandri TaxID=1745969 RepID=A0AAD6XBV4_9AGAR|nr:hypothetical protein C8F04DRAFT_1229980 [Mycena alexandri]